jgi:hypothetical protein
VLRAGSKTNAWLANQQDVRDMQDMQDAKHDSSEPAPDEVFLALLPEKAVLRDCMVNSRDELCVDGATVGSMRLAIAKLNGLEPAAITVTDGIRHLVPDSVVIGALDPCTRAAWMFLRILPGSML